MPIEDCNFPRSPKEETAPATIIPSPGQTALYYRVSRELGPTFVKVAKKMQMMIIHQKLPFAVFSKRRWPV